MAWYLEMHLIIKRILLNSKCREYDHLLAFVPYSLLVFILCFEIFVTWWYVLCYMACEFSMDVTKVKFAFTSTYFVKMNVNVNNVLMLTFSLRFLSNFYLLGLFYHISLSLSGCAPYVNIHARCRTYTNKTRYSKVVWSGRVFRRKSNNENKNAFKRQSSHGI